MSAGRGPGRIPVLLAGACLVVAVAGCSLFGSRQEGVSTAVETGNVVLTATGARTVLRGDTATLSRAVENMFDNFDIYLVGESATDGGKQMRGRTGNTEILVDLEPEPGERVEVSVRVQASGAGGGDRRGRWDRIAARGLLEEIRRWAAQ